ncbi:MAG: phosphodiester glycosidase family protein [Muribaculaceae bacterium]
MSRKNIDIDDNEIRIITSESGNGNSTSPRRLYFVVACAAVAIAVVLLALFWGSDDAAESEELTVTQEATAPVDTAIVVKKGYVEITDTIVGDVPLVILTPRDATPQLHIGIDVLQAPDVVMAVQAADFRSDNGGIVGAYVVEGNLVSKGQTKSGFCAIIDGNITIGVADATPFLEKAIESNGYFFRQYPLVVGNQLVENKPKGRSLRKALAEWNGIPVVVLSRSRLTFHDFAQTLVDLGVANAIYLVGSEAFGFAVDSEGNKTEFGKEAPSSKVSTNYIIWR